MSQPVPLPRRRIFGPDKTEDDVSKCSSTPQSPTKCPEGGLVCSSPPPVLPKKFSVKKSSGGFNSASTLEIIKVMAEEPIYENCKTPPPLPQQTTKAQPDDKYEVKGSGSNLLSCGTPCKDLKEEKEITIIRVKAEQIYKAIQHYNFLLSEHTGTLKQHTDELLCIADNLDKVSKGTKIAGITGGATSVAGGVAAAAGVILSPFTLGASLALTVVGVGVATAGGITGASAAIANKVSVSQDKKKIEKILQEYDRLSTDIQDCLKSISEGMEQLKQHDLSVMSEAMLDSVRVAGVVQLITQGGASARALEANSEASGLMQGFALGMDMYFTKGKQGQKLKKGLASKFAKNIRTLAEVLNKALHELVLIKGYFSKHCSEES